jgi:hypothetical protein
MLSRRRTLSWILGSDQLSFYRHIAPTFLFLFLYDGFNSIYFLNLSFFRSTSRGTCIHGRGLCQAVLFNYATCFSFLRCR